MELIRLSAFDLSLSALLVLSVAVLSLRLHLGVERQIVIAALRTVVQLTLVGLVLKALFAHVHVLWMMLIALVMLAAAGYEVGARQQRRFAGPWGFAMGTASMFVSTFSVTLLALTVIIQPHPWYQPQYAIPLLGMLFGNSMNGVALSLDRLTHAAWQQQAVIEARLLLGQTWHEAVADIRRDSVRSGLIPTINAMAAAGIVSLPGMMTGQILAGAPPVAAVNYQILIMFLITAGSGFGTLAATTLAARRLFDQRHRLRLDRLKAPPAR